MLKKIAFLVMILVAMILTGCASLQSNGNDPHKQIKVSYQIKKENKLLDKKSVTVKKGVNVLTGLKKAWTTKTEKKMVTEIEGHAQDPDLDQYWVYEVNGEESNKGVTEQKLHDKDQITFTLKDISK